jgi:shikimate kinase
MSGFAEAEAHGAATIINAIATGRGAAFGVSLWTKARVKLTDDVGYVKAKILSDPTEDTLLIKETVLTVLHHFHLKDKYGVDVETESNIPIARGMKSSSVAANALILATVAALGAKLSDLEVLNLSVEAAIKAKTTITGAFDDSCASFFGNIVITDNFKRRILKCIDIEDNLEILFQIPSKKSYTYALDSSKMKCIEPQVEVAFKEAFSGNYWTALTLNGILYSTVLGFDASIAVAALEAGALAAGLSGKGPAVVAVVQNDKAQDIVHAWHQYEGRIVKTGVNKEKAKVTRRE